jgi:protein-S-isoprenylcysteine O-methyltransferase Ste14
MNGDSAGRVAWRAANIPVPEEHLATLAAAVVLHRVRPWRVGGRRPVRWLIGAALAGAGVAVVSRSVRAARQVHLADPQRLVTVGPYARSRNPMYAGWTLLHVGAGLATNSAWVLATWPAAALLVHRGVLGEERTLAGRFGAEYARYRSEVPRYLPAWHDAGTTPA